MHMALMLVLAVAPTVPAESVKCARCADVGQVLAPIVAASYDACFDPGFAQPTRTATFRLDVAKDGAVSRAKLTARGNLNAARAKCVVNVLREMKLPASSGGVRIQLGLQFTPTPPMPAEAPPDPRGRCPAPGYWDEQSHSCKIAPCAGIPGGCRNDPDDLLKVGKGPR